MQKVLEFFRVIVGIFLFGYLFGLMVMALTFFSVMFPLLGKLSMIAGLVWIALTLLRKPNVKV